MDKILILGLLLVLIVFIIISYNSKSEILENRVNDNIDKQEYFHTSGGKHVQQSCCSDGRYGTKPNCILCPSGTTSVDEATSIDCTNLLSSSCKPCPTCFEVQGYTCQPKRCQAGMRCVTVTNKKKGQVAGNCYYW